MSQLGDSQAGEVPSYSAFHASRPFNCLGEAHPHCRVQSDSYVNHIQKCPHRHTQNTVRPQSWAPCGPVKVTRKMSPHRQPAHRPSLDTVWALSCGYLDRSYNMTYLSFLTLSSENKSKNEVTGFGQKVWAAVNRTSKGPCVL